MKTKEFRQITDDELKQKKAALKQSLLDLRFKARSGTLEKPSRIRQAKRDIAKIETILREKENETRKKQAKA